MWRLTPRKISAAMYNVRIFPTHPRPCPPPSPHNRRELSIEISSDINVAPLPEEARWVELEARNATRTDISLSADPPVPRPQAQGLFLRNRATRPCKDLGVVRKLRAMWCRSMNDCPLRLYSSRSTFTSCVAPSAGEAEACKAPPTKCAAMQTLLRPFEGKHPSGGNTLTTSSRLNRYVRVKRIPRQA